MGSLILLTLAFIAEVIDIWRMKEKGNNTGVDSIEFIKMKERKTFYRIVYLVILSEIVKHF